MSILIWESPRSERVTRDGAIDEPGGLATLILAILGLTGLYAPILAAVATILLGVTLLIQGRAMMSEYTRTSVLLGEQAPVSSFNANIRSAVILLGAGAIALGVLALLDYDSAVLTPVASILLGLALVLSSIAAWHLNVLNRASRGEQTRRDRLADQLALDSIGVQIFAALAAIVLAILATSGATHDLTFNLVALLILGSALVLKGGSLNAILLGFLRAA